MIIEEVKGKKDDIEEIVKEHDLMFAVLYGSTAKGEMNSESDLDFAVLKNEKPSLNEVSEINCSFMDLFSREVDVKFLNEKSPFFKHQVMKNSLFLAGDERSYNSFKLYAFKSYCDSFKLMDLRKEMTDKRLKDLSNV